MRYALMMIVIMLAMMGCTPTGTTTTTTIPSDPTPTPEGGSGEVVGDPGSGFGIETGLQGQGFIATITGAGEAQIEGDGYIACENNRLVIRPTSSGLQQVTLIVAPTISGGVYNLVSMGGVDPVAMVSFSDNRVFASGVNGVLVLTAISTQAGQSVTGSFEFSASNGSGLINATGEFDFVVTETISCG